MKNLFRRKPSSYPPEFTQEAQLFVLVFQQRGEDFAPLRREVKRHTPLLERLGSAFVPLLCLLQLPWLWSQLQTTGWTMAALRNNWFFPLTLALLGYNAWHGWNVRRQFVRQCEKFPWRTLIVVPSGCVVFASNERGQFTEPPLIFFWARWRAIIGYSNTNERAILVGKGYHAVLISNRILGCSCSVTQASRILDELLAPPLKDGPPIAEPN
jgi:hypothetical protein